MTGDGMTHRDDPQTSHLAADVIRDKLPKIQQAVVDAIIKHGPMSGRQAEKLPEFECYGFATIRKRISELAQKGVLVNVGLDRDGTPATVYDIRRRKTETLFDMSPHARF